MVREGNEIYDIYKINVKERLDIKKVVLIILIIFVVIGFMMVTEKCVEIINQHKVYKQYEAQLIALKKQEEDRQAEIERERERIKQEKIPKLTQVR